MNPSRCFISPFWSFFWSKLHFLIFFRFFRWFRSRLFKKAFLERKLFIWKLLFKTSFFIFFRFFRLFRSRLFKKRLRKIKFWLKNFHRKVLNLDILISIFESVKMFHFSILIILLIKISFLIYFRFLDDFDQEFFESFLER